MEKNTREKVEVNFLVVEDNLEALEAAKKVFGAKGVVYVEDLESAIKDIDEFEVKVVITDLFYPQRKGSGLRDHAEELAERIENFCKQLFNEWSEDDWLNESNQRTLDGISKWLPSKDEKEQPLGIWLMDELKEKGFDPRQIVVTSNLDHHHEKAEAAFVYIWNSTVNDDGDPLIKIQEVHPDEKSKDEAFWRRVRMDIFRKSFGLKA